MLAHRFAITYLPQKFEEHHQPTERSDRSLSLAQFHFFSAPKRGKFPVHCFVLLGVSFNQLKLNRDRAKQCYLISEFRFSVFATKWKSYWSFLSTQHGRSTLRFRLWPS